MTFRFFRCLIAERLVVNLRLLHALISFLVSTIFYSSSLYAVEIVAGLTGTLEVRAVSPAQTLNDGRTTALIWVDDVFFTPDGGSAIAVKNYCAFGSCDYPDMNTPYMTITDPDGVVVELGRLTSSGNVPTVSSASKEDFQNYKPDYNTGRMIGRYTEFTKRGAYNITVTVRYGIYTATINTTVTQALMIPRR